MEKVCNKKVPTLMAATLLGSQMVEKNPKAGVSLKLRMQKLKDSIIREATIRESHMHDLDEETSITNALKALEDGETDVGKARAILTERLSHVQRRISQTEASFLDDESSSEEDEDEAKKGGKGVEQQKQKQVASDKDISSVKYWEDIILSDPDLKLSFSIDVEEGEFSQEYSQVRLLREELRDRGFLNIQQVASKKLAESVRRIILRLQTHQWPPIFAFVYDEPWQLIKSIWKYVEQLMKGPVYLEPSFTAFHLNHQKDRNQERYMGTNFGLPHRDYTFADSTFSDGSPKILSVWLPLNTVTTENGCMYVVPREFDANFEKDGAYEHKQVMAQGGLKGMQFLNFPLNGIQPLPGEAGALMCWYGNAIHWGSSCHSTGASDPRASMALVFRRADAFQNFEQPCLQLSDLEDASLEQRIKLIKTALGCFNHWYNVPESLAEKLAGM